MGLGEAVSEDDGDAGQASKHVRPALWTKERRQEISAHPIFSHPLTKLIGGTLALLLLFIICGGGAASVQVRQACPNLKNKILADGVAMPNPSHLCSHVSYFYVMILWFCARMCRIST